MELKNSPIAAESGHWYTPGGKPAYTIIGKNGKERNTTLRDARTNNLRPSVTTILRVASAPGLEKWKRDQLLMAAATLPKIEGEPLEDWMERVSRDSQEQGWKAMELGTSIHSSLEKAYEGKSFQTDHSAYVVATMQAIHDKFGTQPWRAEKSFASDLGFGGKIDLSSDEIVIDFKTSAFDDPEKKVGYDENLMQVAAYAMGLKIGSPRCANVFVSTTVPGLTKVVEWSAEDIARGWEQFKCLLNYWQLQKGYVPNA